MKRIYLENLFGYKGYKCACTFTAGGHRCGYVAVNNEHPYYKKDFSDEGPNEIKCHWGLTYAGDGQHFNPDDTTLWWFGFDCAHYQDGVDYDTAKEYGLVNDKEYLIGKEFSAAMNEEATIKTSEFVEENCKMIVEQFIAVKKRGY